MKPEIPPLAERRCISLGADFTLRLIRLFSDVFQGDVTAALVFLAAAQACTQHLRRPSAACDSLSDGLYPDELRRPVSVSALARSLGLPVETTRRHVIKLAGQGYVHRSHGGGVLVTSDILRREEIKQIVKANAANVLQFITGLSQKFAEP